tara:strand:- start:77 stop:373 length:297 start_codon:yes stop_codon:yes gene_type:complete
MFDINLIELVVQNFLNSKFYLKIFLLVLLFFFSLIIYCLFLDIINFLFRKFFLKKNLVIKEKKLLKVRKKYLDGKINAKEYKVCTFNILGNLDKNEYK